MSSMSSRSGDNDLAAQAGRRVDNHKTNAIAIGSPKIGSPKIAKVGVL